MGVVDTIMGFEVGGTSVCGGKKSERKGWGQGTWRLAFIVTRGVLSGGGGQTRESGMALEILRR